MPILQYATDREEWSYMCIDSDYSGIEMQPRADLYEVVYVKDPLDAVSGCFQVSAPARVSDTGLVLSRPYQPLSVEIRGAQKKRKNLTR
jgi:hypothetical protein